MKSTKYQKVSSYEINKNKIDKVILLYSGGLDTSVMLKWIQDNYCEKVVALYINIGQQKDNVNNIKEKAKKLGAFKVYIIDAKDEFAEQYLSYGIKANASYQGNYHLSTPIGRPLLAKWAVEIAHKEKTNVIAHGCTGKGNDQVRIEGSIITLDPKMKVIAPVREWNMDRNEEIKYAKLNNIPVPVDWDCPYSVDDNMWGMTWEGGELEDPQQLPKYDKFLKTYTLPENASNKPEYIKLFFDNGIPTTLNGKKMKLADLIIKLNTIGGTHGVGITTLVEDRLVGVKNRGVYEMPAAHIIIKSHQSLEKYVSTRNLNEIKEIMDIKWAYLCYGGLWLDQSMQAINAFNNKVNKNVCGEVTVKLFKGSAIVIAMKSDYALGYSSFLNSEGYDFNINASAGFIEIYSLQMKLANQIKKHGGKYE